MIFRWSGQKYISEVFQVFFSKMTPRTIMKTRLFGHSLNPGAPWTVQDSLNESSVRPNGTPVMPLLHFGHGWLFRSKTTNYLLCKFSYEGNNNYNNQRFWWQEPPGKIIFVLFCFATCRDEEKETQNINVVGKTNLSKEKPPKGISLRPR